MHAPTPTDTTRKENGKQRNSKEKIPLAKRTTKPATTNYMNTKDTLKATKTRSMNLLLSVKRTGHS